ncbi:MAG: N-acetyltransferase [Gemmatimonadales bacterium]
MQTELRQVTDRAGLKQFVAFPYELYDRRRYPNWVAPLRAAVYDALDEKKNPFYREADRALFLALRDGAVVGRIAAIENRAHNAFHGDRTGFFGFFECIDDQAVADGLFRVAGDWLGDRGLETMQGPMNPSTNYECGLLVDGFEHRPTFMTAWNPPYYDTLCAGAGLAKAKDLLGFWFPAAEPGYQLPEFVERQAARALEKGRMEFRDLDPGKFNREVAACWEIYNDAWERNWGFVPMSRAEFEHMAKDMKHLLWPELAFLASVDGQPAGFMLALPDYNEALRKNRSGRLFPLGLLRMLWGKRTIRTARVMALGVKKEFRSRSILALFTAEVMRRGLAMGKIGAEASWLLEDNQLIVKPMRAMGARERMRWRVYERAT